MGKVTKVALKGKDRSAKLMLEQIVKFLQTDDQESENLWNILTALRGPDIDSGNLQEDVKNRTTARIRGTIGLNQ
jgi:hypothetical protein